MTSRTGSAVDVDADVAEIGGDQAAVQPRGAEPDSDRSRASGRWCGPGDRPAIAAAQSLDATALLIDENRRVRPADRVAEGGRGRVLVSGSRQFRLNRIRPQRLLAGEEIAFVVDQPRPGAAAMSATCPVLGPRD
jgi:hypothetical protein